MRTENRTLVLNIADDGLRVEVSDKLRRCRWTLTPANRGLLAKDNTRLSLPAGQAEPAGEGAIRVTHEVRGGRLVFCWALEEDHVRLRLDCQLDASAAIAAVDAPGRLAAGTSTACDVLVPIYQGALLRSSGGNWQQRVGRGGHTAASMGLAGLLAERGGLLMTPDELVDWTLTYGDDANGAHAWLSATPCAVDGWRSLTVRLCPCDPTVTAMAKCYRTWARRRGQWVPWEAKLAAKPALRGLFGTLMTFVGYVHDPQTDYVAGARRLREMGFESVYMYPVRFAHYSRKFTMAGRKPIDLDDATLAALHDVPGVHVAPWAWTIEGIDDGSQAMHAIYRHGRDGGLAGGWSMDNQRWQFVCTPYQIEHIRRRLAGDMREMDWLHFDVNATLLPPPCFRTDHALHAGRPLSARTEVAEVQRLLSADTVGNRVVSSEGFNDAYTAAYDIGSTKMLPSGDPDSPAVPVPLTMLVYHDCCVHDWWEMHNYNANPCWTLETGHTGHTPLGRAGSGQSHLKAAMDALYGLPPNVFPFGTQYGWRNKACGETYGFRMTLGDPPVREALAAALPVARLHARIGQQELMDFELLSDSRLVQRTTFADGTRVVANLSDQPAEVEGAGRLAPGTWIVQ